MASISRSVLITGAAGGVGGATVKRLDELGWRVLAAVRSLDTAPAALTAARNVTPIELDICDAVSIARAREEIAEHLGGSGLNGLVNNAGLSVDGPLELVPVEALRRQFDVNVIGQVAITQAVLPMLRTGRGRVVNVGGAAGRMTLPLYGALSASKAALDSLSDALRMELEPQGISVAYIEPGALQTPFFEKSARAVAQDGRTGSPEIRAIYAEALEASAKALAEASAAPVDAAAKAIVKALTTGKPSARYVVGRDAKMGLALLPKLPARIRDRVLLSSLGIKPALLAGSDGRGGDA
jgi:NAD(P)-dependent dehydrogenase (short-subunit alcohol dehydrogenase family)